MKNSIFYISSKVQNRLVQFTTRALWGTFSKYRYYFQMDRAGVKHAYQIHTHMRYDELNTLHKLAVHLGDSPKILEIGSYLGASSCFLAAAIKSKNGKLICVDTWWNQTMPDGERDTYQEFCKNTQDVSSFITTIRKDSRYLGGTDIPEQLDMVFIDGDHSYRAVKNDYERVSPCIRPNGILAFHDFLSFRDVSRVLGEVLTTGEWQLAGITKNLVWLRKIKNSWDVP